METPEPSYHSEASDVSVTSDKPPTKHETPAYRFEGGLNLKCDYGEILKILNHRESNEGKQAESKNFNCNFCKAKFSTSQALKGHQNAHTQEKALSKRPHNMVDMASGAPPLPCGVHYYPYSAFPIHGGFKRSSLGVRYESMIQKQPYSSYHQTWLSPSLACRFTQEKVPMAYAMRPLPPAPLNFHSLGGNSNPIIIDDEETTKVKEGESSSLQRLRLEVVEGDGDQHDASGIDLQLKL